MKWKALLGPACAISIVISQVRAEDEAPLPDLKPFSGEYTFNPNCTDADALVKVSFRKATEKEGNEDDWRADGTLTDRIRNVTVEFKGAMVSKDPEDGAIVVDGIFVCFRLSGRGLTWDKTFGIPLEKREAEEAEKAETPAAK